MDAQDTIFNTEHNGIQECNSANNDLGKDQRIVLPPPQTPDSKVQNLLCEAGNTSIDFGTSSRGRHRKMSHCMQEATAQGLMNNFNQTMEASAGMPKNNTSAFMGNDFDARLDYKLQLQDCMWHPISFHAKTMGGIMYLHQALQQQDAAEFLKAVVKEVNSHVEQKHWRLFEQSKVPEGMDP